MSGIGRRVRASVRAGFRPASERPAWANLARTATQTALFWTVLLWLVPSGIVRLEAALGMPGFGASATTSAGWGILLIASVGGLWSGATMARLGRGTPLPLDTARELVVAGPYRLVRNPMAVTGLAQGLGVSLILGSWTVLLYVLAGGVLWHVLVRPIEEADLLDRFGEEYSAYRERVRVWLPRL